MASSLNLLMVVGAALSYVSGDQRQAVLFVYQLEDGQAATPVRTQGLHPTFRYFVEEVNLPSKELSRLAEQGKFIHGAQLMDEGLAHAGRNAFENFVIELTAIKIS